MKQRRFRKALDLTRLLAVFVLIIGISYFYLNVLNPALIPRSLRIGFIRQPFNLLVLGTDITFDALTLKPMPGKKGRADTLLLVRIDPIKHQVNVLSIPRDTYVEISGVGRSKINAANAYGGLPLVKETITQLTGQKIDHFIEIKPTAVTRMVDLLGGVTIDVEQRMRYVDKAQGLDIDLHQGEQKLSGKQAHDYIRYRNNYSGDIGRVRRQQKFLKALTKSLVSPANFLKAPFVIHTALAEIKTDLPLSQVIRLLNWGRLIDISNIETVMVPGDVKMINEPGAGSVWVPDLEKLDQEIRAMF